MKFVIYYRVSTKGQGESGLGLEAQERDVNLYLKNYVQGKYEIIETVTDIKSGKGDLNKRPELKRAVEIAKKEGAILLVAKLDRLSRDVETIAHLMKHSEFKVACMPNAGKFELHLYAALAEQERDFISQRTKAALAEAKAKGKKLGSHAPDIAAMNKASKAAANDRAESYRAEFEMMVNNGFSTKQITESLNERGIKTLKSGEWHTTQVSRTLKRLGLVPTKGKTGRKSTRENIQNLHD